MAAERLRAAADPFPELPPLSSVGSNQWFYGVLRRFGWEGGGLRTLWSRAGGSVDGPPPASVALSGSGPPAAGLGVVGSYCLDLSARTFYGPKAASGWPTTAARFGGPKAEPGSPGIPGTPASARSVPRKGRRA
ncbi:hypothetical protein ABZ543_12980 [Streptomyces roseifaciens]